MGNLAPTVTSQPAALTETLDEFMARLEATSYIANLLKEDVKMRDLMTFIREEELVQLGLPMGPRRRILNELDRLRALEPDLLLLHAPPL